MTFHNAKVRCNYSTTPFRIWAITYIFPFEMALVSSIWCLPISGVDIDLLFLGKNAGRILKLLV